MYAYVHSTVSEHFGLYIQLVCTVHTTCLYCTYTMSVLCIQLVCTAHTLCLYCAYNLSVLYRQLVCTVHTTCLYCTYTMSVLCIQLVCPVQATCLYCFNCCILHLLSQLDQVASVSRWMEAPLFPSLSQV